MGLFGKVGKWLGAAAYALKPKVERPKVSPEEQHKRAVAVGGILTGLGTALGQPELAAVGTGITTIAKVEEGDFKGAVGSAAQTITNVGVANESENLQKFGGIVNKVGNVIPSNGQQSIESKRIQELTEKQMKDLSGNVANIKKGLDLENQTLLENATQLGKIVKSGYDIYNSSRAVAKGVEQIRKEEELTRKGITQTDKDIKAIGSIENQIAKNVAVLSQQQLDLNKTNKMISSGVKALDHEEAVVAEEVEELIQGQKQIENELNKSQDLLEEQMTKVKNFGDFNRLISISNSYNDAIAIVYRNEDIFKSLTTRQQAMLIRQINLKA